MSLLRKALTKRCKEELLNWGKCNELLTDKEMEAKKADMANEQEEKPIDSSKFNRILLHRSQHKETRDQDLKDLIRRVVSREPPQIKVGLTREEKERIKRTFTTEEVWNVCVPGDFKGSKVEYLIWLRNDKKEAEERKKGIKHDWKHQHKKNAKVVTGDEMIAATAKKFTTDNDRIYNPYGDKTQN